jgi:hypothetical protein
MSRNGDNISRHARGRERMRTDQRGDDGTVRSTSAGAPRGGEVRPEGCGARTWGRVPASVSGYGGTTAYDARGTRDALERGGAFRPLGSFRVAMFNGDFLPILQLKFSEE